MSLIACSRCLKVSCGCSTAGAGVGFTRGAGVDFRCGVGIGFTRETGVGLTRGVVTLASKFQTFRAKNEERSGQLSYVIDFGSCN